MIQKNLLKNIILNNEQHILKKLGQIVRREKILLPETLKKVITIYGVRRSGKTYLLYEIFKNNPDNSLYIDFEDEQLSDFGIHDFDQLLKSFFELKPHLLGKKVIFLLDEVQNVFGWEKFCRRIVEKENVKVFASGSSSKIMPAEIHTALRGRAWGVELLPFSFREYLAIKNLNISDKSLFHGYGSIPVKKLFLEYLEWGGFPEVACANSEIEKSKIIKEYLGAMFFKDLVERYNATNIPLLDALIDALLSSPSLKFSPVSFAKNHKGKFPFSKDLLYSYYKHFLDSMIIFETRKFSPSSYKRLRNPPKTYLVDTGISKRVTSPNNGWLLENLVFLELHRRENELFYYEEDSECDFIARDKNGGISCAQVTFELSDVNREREIKGLVSTCKFLKVSEGTIFTYDDEEELSTEGIKIKVIPSWRWVVE